MILDGVASDPRNLGGSPIAGMRLEVFPAVYVEVESCRVGSVGNKGMASITWDSTGGKVAVSSH
jgi:hypothetical protein